MPKFSIGDIVREVVSNKRGQIVSVGQPSRGRQTYDIRFDGSANAETILESFLLEDFDISNPFDRIKKHKFGSYDDFARINTSYKIENSSNSTIASLKASKTLFKAYQFKPLLKFLNSENRRLLVADEVGLGKTIEAGHIMLEMLARKELRNVLIICPKSLRLKWKNEMDEKFNLKFKIYENAKDFLSDIRMRNGSFRGIINYERVQAPRKDDKKKQEDPNSFLNIIVHSAITFSLVLCDEAHKVRNASTATHRGVELIAAQARSMVMLTATPIMISDENLYNLLHILAPVQFDNDIEFHNSLSLNQPFLQTLRELRTARPLRDICADLSNAEIALQYRFYNEDNGSEFYRPQIVKISDYYADNPLYQRCVETMKSGDDNLTIRAKLQFDITSMSELNNIFSRTRRREITTDWTQAERHPFPISVELNPKEREVFDDVIEQYIEDNSYIDEWGEEKLNAGASLGLVTKKRQVASSVYAYLNDDDDLDKGIDRYADCEDAKVSLLLNILEEVLGSNGEKKIILFAIFKKTLKYLRIRLGRAGYKCAVILGGMENRDEELARFKHDPQIQILLSSEVGSEGLDLQFCHSMVNYDLPWNPMVVEQRIGRIDRFGQLSPIVKIYNLVVHNSIQEDIYQRLLMRIGIFTESIGDLEAILDASYAGTTDTIQSAYTKLEKDLFCNNLSATERQRKIDDIAQAIENEKQQIKKIEENQTNTLTIDTYFQNEVNRILTTHSYLTDNELLSYVVLLIHKRLPACALESIGNGTYKFCLPKANVGCLKNFLAQYVPSDDESQYQFSVFKTKTMEKSEFLITFKQEVAYENPEIIFVNIHHPIIQAALQYFNIEKNPNDITFVFDIDIQYLPVQLMETSYFLAIYSIETSYVVQGALKETSTQYPILYDWKNDMVIADENIVFKMLGQSQVYGSYRNIANLPDYNDEHIENLKYALLENVSKYAQERKQDLEVNLRSQQNIKLSQMEKFHQFQEMARLENQLRRAQDAYTYAWSDEERKNAEQRIKATETRMQNVEQEYQEKRAILLRDFELKVSYKLVSINLINIK